MMDQTGTCCIVCCDKRQILESKKGLLYSYCHCLSASLTDVSPFLFLFSNFRLLYSRNKSGATHNTGYKTRSRKNRLGTSDVITGTKVNQRMKLLLGVN
jgi:hypothetical protein